MGQEWVRAQGRSHVLRSGVQLSMGGCWDGSIMAQQWQDWGEWGQDSQAVSSSLLLVVSQGVDEGPDGLRLISDIIHEKLGIEMSVLMGANIASEVAEEKFCETTIGKEPTSGSSCQQYEHLAVSLAQMNGVGMGETL